MSALADYHPFAPETGECPYPFYAAMRPEAPVYEVPGMGFVIVTRYEDLQCVLTHPELFSSKTGPGVKQQPPRDVLDILAQGWMRVTTRITNDPLSHRCFCRVGEHHVYSTTNCVA